MRRSENIGKLAEALNKAQQEFSPAPYDSKNPHFNMKYASLTSIIEAAKPMHKHGLSFTQALEFAEGRVAVTTMLLHTSGEWIETTLSLKPRNDSPQDAGSAATYGRRYGLSAILGICSDEDDDGNSATQPGKKPATSPKGAPPANPPKAPAGNAAPAGNGSQTSGNPQSKEGNTASSSASAASPASSPENKPLRFFCCAVCRAVITERELPKKCAKCPSEAFQEFPTLEAARAREAEKPSTTPPEKTPPVTPPDPQPDGKAIATELNKIFALAKAKGADNRAKILELVGKTVGREIKSSTDLSADERKKCLEVLA